MHPSFCWTFNVGLSAALGKGWEGFEMHCCLGCSASGGSVGRQCLATSARSEFGVFLGHCASERSSPLASFSAFSQLTLLWASHLVAVVTGAGGHVIAVVQIQPHS